MDKILITGGAGYIGSHTAVELLNAGYGVVAVDNLSNSTEESIRRVKKICGRDLDFTVGDARDYALMSELFKKHPIRAVIHFAGLKAVGESVRVPLKYYENNICSTLNLLRVMGENGCKNIVFSSSATVYGNPDRLPLTEDCALGTANPYGTTKLFIEYILKDLYISDPLWNIAVLRYFNPVGAHKSGLIGEDPAGIPNNLMPYVAKVAGGALDELSVFGDDYPTPDGTGRRDYIHITDLARGHLAALAKLDGMGYDVFNLGTGMSYSVLEMVKAFQRASGRPVKYKIAPRRAGDIAECYASPRKAQEKLGWTAELGLDDMCADLWNWQVMNPQGYAADDK